MECPECKIKNRTISSLQNSIQELKIELNNYKTQLNYLINERKSIGSDAEKAISDLIEGSSLTKNNALTDLILSNGDKIEIKHSRLNKPMDNCPTKRWTWSRLFGEKGETKDWKFLILRAEKDSKYWPIEKDNSPYIHFLLDRQLARQCSAPKNQKGLISITTNPKTVRSPQGRRLLQCRISTEIIQNLFSNIDSRKIEYINTLIYDIKKKIQYMDYKIKTSPRSLVKTIQVESLASRCIICGVAVSERVRKFCINRPKRFGNKIYCYHHQQSIKNN